MAEDDVVDVVLAAVTLFEIFSSDTDTSGNAKKTRAPRQCRQRPRRYWVHDVNLWRKVWAAKIAFVSVKYIKLQMLCHDH